MGQIRDQRVLVVGASSGVGAATARILSAEGAQVVAAARRKERLDEAVKEDGLAGGVVCDVRSPESCARAVEETLEILGGLDALVFLVGIVQVIPIEEISHEDWVAAFETNAIGPSLVTREALPALEQSRGRVIFTSSIAALDHPPRRGFSPYVASKAALDKMVVCWEKERPKVAFTRFSLGDTGGTEAATDWDQEWGKRFLGEWIQQGRMVGRTMDVETVGRHIMHLLSAEEAIPVSVLEPRPAIPEED